MPSKPEIRVSRFVAFMERIENRRRERYAIEMMNDRMLADIGVSLDQLGHSVRSAACSGRVVLPALGRGAV
jgi:uncharacterized protein YjiS (DUF1127 family)